MLFYHGTTEEAWEEIKKQEKLGFDNKVLYLASELSEALCYGEELITNNK